MRVSGSQFEDVRSCCHGVLAVAALVVVFTGCTGTLGGSDTTGDTGDNTSVTDDDDATGGDDDDSAGDDDDDNGGTDSNAQRLAALASITDNVIVPTLTSFETKSKALDSAVKAWAASPGDTAKRDAARAAFRDAMLVWQEAEVLQVGPAASSTARAGGTDLRDRIYAWPTVNPCRVDQEIVAKGYERADFFTSPATLVNVIGLATLEYLLFYDGAANQCPPQALINSSGSWGALSADERAARRANYAAGAAAEIRRLAGELLKAWQPTGGNFAGKLKQPGQGDSPFTSSQFAIDQVYAGMFYVYVFTTDDKLGVPSGVVPPCAAETCPELQESRFADLSREYAAVNLRAYRKLFLGAQDDEQAKTAVGYDDLLIGAGAGDLAKEMLTKIDAAIAAVDGDSRSLTTLLAEDAPKVRAMFDASNAATRPLKEQFVTVLNLTLPQEGAGDND